MPSHGLGGGSAAWYQGYRTVWHCHGQFGQQHKGIQPTFSAASDSQQGQGGGGHSPYGGKGEPAAEALLATPGTMFEAHCIVVAWRTSADSATL